MKKKEIQIKFESLGAEDRNRTGTVSLPQDFKSCASACSATSAYMVAEIGLEPTTPRVWTECSSQLSYSAMFWLRGQDLNLRPSGYEPDELPTAPPRDIKLNLVIGAEDRNRTGTVSLPQDFKSCASACSATSAYSYFSSPPDDKINYILCFITCQHFFAIFFIFLRLFM